MRQNTQVSTVGLSHCLDTEMRGNLSHTLEWIPQPRSRGRVVLSATQVGTNAQAQDPIPKTHGTQQQPTFSLSIVMLAFPPSDAPVSYTHLRAHET